MRAPYLTPIFIPLLAAVCPAVLLCASSVASAPAKAARPDILFLISDDQSWLHTSAAGCRALKTPTFDRVASQGVRFTHAFASSPGCAPSRGAILSGQAFWRLGEGAVQRSSFPGSIPVYPEVLEKAGYHVGLQGKGWGPGTVRQRPHNPAGKAYPSFEHFLSTVPPGTPFCFWFGGTDPHRPYQTGSGLRAGKKLGDVDVPAFLPDVPEVRSDLLDYFAAIERFDRDAGSVLDALEASGRAANTLVFVTSDNGMPFPRAKTNLYDSGVRVPLAVRWPSRIKGGRVVEDFLSLADCAPTILAAAGLEPLPEMTAQSFLGILLSGQSGRVDPGRSSAAFGRERHGTSWPCRALRTATHLYIRNFAPERRDGLVADASPTKEFISSHAVDPSYRRFHDLAFGARQPEELYDLRRDPDQLENLASERQQAEVLGQLREQLETELGQTGDPRLLGRGEEFDRLPGAGKPEKSRVVDKKEAASVLSPAVDCDVAVLGGGSGGFGAALAAARLGLDVVLVEKADCLGGTSVRSGVNCWEMGIGGTGFPFELYKELKRQPNAVSIYSFGRHAGTFDPAQERFRYPGGETVSDAQRRYVDTLQRHIPEGRTNSPEYRREHWHGVPFEPDAMAKTMRALLDATGRCRVLLNTSFVAAEASDGRVHSVELSSGTRLRARFYVDATGDGVVCVAAGCETMTGQEPRSRFNEPDAPEKPTARVNGVTLIYRAAPVNEPRVEPLASGVPEACWWRKGFPGAHVNHYPNGDLNINMLPTMEGDEFLRLGYEAAYAECQRRVRAHWHDWQSRFEEFRGYRLVWIAPALGVRESRRVLGEYVLSENDLLAGLSGQRHPDIICLADHSLDTHGGHSKHRGELKQPYGVPYRCLIPRGYRNLLVACRAASFSSLAASSCRLSRTMMQMGQAAGTAAALAKELSMELPAVPPERLRESLRRQHVQLEHPMPAALRTYLEKE